MRALIIEDEIQAVRCLEGTLAKEGIVCTVTNCGYDGLAAIKTRTHDFVILDLGLPDIDGLEVLKRIRKTNIKIPVIIVSAIATNKEIALDYGADDYLSKPYTEAELLARVKAVLRRSKGYAKAIAEFDEIVLEYDTRTVKVNNTVVDLTKTEYCILEFITARAGEVVSKQSLIDHLYGKNPDERPDAKVIDVFVCKLRKKLAAINGKNYIQTFWGQGYILNSDGSNVPMDEQEDVLLDESSSEVELEEVEEFTVGSR